MTTLIDLKTRLRAALVDSGAQVWADATLDEGIRQALGELALAGTAALTLEGLDGAAATTLNPLHESLVVWGAAGFAALARAVQRNEVYSLAGRAETLQTWGAARLSEFRAMLAALYPGGAGAAEAARLKGLRESDQPWGVWEA